MVKFLSLQSIPYCWSNPTSTNTKHRIYGEMPTVSGAIIHWTLPLRLATYDLIVSIVSIDVTGGKH